jgi:hypothetical protein
LKIQWKLNVIQLNLPRHLQTIIDSTIVDADSQNIDNYLFNTNFISFLQDNFMPSFLIGLVLFLEI